MGRKKWVWAVLGEYRTGVHCPLRWRQRHSANYRALVDFVLVATSADYTKTSRYWILGQFGTFVPRFWGWYAILHRFPTDCAYVMLSVWPMSPCPFPFLFQWTHICRNVIKPLGSARIVKLNFVLLCLFRVSTWIRSVGRPARIFPTYWNAEFQYKKAQSVPID